MQSRSMYEHVLEAVQGDRAWCDRHGINGGAARIAQGVLECMYHRMGVARTPS